MLRPTARAQARATVRMKPLCCAGLLIWASLAQAAEERVPGGLIYAGVGINAIRRAAGGGTAVSLEGQIELGPVFVGGTFLIGHAGGQGVAFVGPRAGLVLSAGSTVAPYVSLGYGEFAQGVLFDDPKNTRAFLPEVGVAFFRGNQFGRVTISAMALLLTSRTFVPKHPDDRLDNWYGLTLRLML